MDASFRKYTDQLLVSYDRLMSMSPLRITSLPRAIPNAAIYLLSEGEKHLYVGRTRNLRRRLSQHTRPNAGHNQAVFAFRLAREKTGIVKASYSKKGSRSELERDPAFSEEFSRSKTRVRQMDLRFVEEPEPLRQALLEIYVHIALQTPFNDFDTH